MTLKLGRKPIVWTHLDEIADTYGYLNIYKNHMMTAIRALDFFNNVNSEKNCNEQGCKIND